MANTNEIMYRSNNVIHGQGVARNATGIDINNPRFAARDLTSNGIGKRAVYFANNAVSGQYNNYSTLNNIGGSTHCAHTTLKTSATNWRPKFADTPKSVVLANQATHYKTHWGRMNTIGEARYINVTNENVADSPFEKLANIYNYSPNISNIKNVGNKIRYCWLIPKTVRQAFKTRRANAAHLPSPNFFNLPANADLKNQLKGPIMIPAGATIKIKKDRTDAIIITNLDSGHGGNVENTGVIVVQGVNRTFTRLFQPNVIVEATVQENS